ncbi:acyl-CoA N-acyltransferase [Cladorrhinum sp. PSN259]|nr:acyl-CoA N-acyltransferase [Cladorrhinum sp. PSN259]
MAPKRRRAPTDLIDIANGKTDEQFIADYLQSDWITTWTHPKTSETYTLSLIQPSKLSDTDLQACFDLIAETSKHDYENSAGKWKPAHKLKEMKSPELRYILVKDFAGKTVRGFTSLMPTYEDGQPVIYCYEIHLKPELQGSGLGRLLMGMLVKVAERVPPVKKVMLTCFLANERGVRFYQGLGFEKDEISPVERRLRGNKVVKVDYVIMSREVERRNEEEKEEEQKEEEGKIEEEANGIA